MQVHWVGDNLAQVYPELVKAALDGKKLNPRNRPNTEIRPVLLETTTRYPCLYGREINYRFALAEMMAMVCGWDDVAWPAKFLPGIKKFGEDGIWFRGAYGRRLIFPVDQIKRALSHLTVDSDSRQCVLQIWEAAADTVTHQVRDRPCNTAMYVKIRDKEVDVTVFRRSADLIWGVPYDHFVFAGFQEIFAALLGRKPGKLRQYIDSLHVYFPEAKFYDAERIYQAEHTPKTPKTWEFNWQWSSKHSIGEVRELFRHIRECVMNGITPATMRYEKPQFWSLYHFLEGGDLPCW